ncbi:MAG: glycerol kinase GlpK [Alphaproteobacteria bacterium]|nr:glycerol kinase GlpK [Alphaproteobacteria bacterium]
MAKAVMAIDQGTTSSRAILFDEDFNSLSVAQQEFTQFYPKSGWVEHDADEIWRSVVDVARDAVAQAGLTAADIAAIGITNQRETVVVWDRATREPIHPAIVWQDRRTADFCSQLKTAGHEAMVTAKTGLLLDPYFSGTKLAWLLDRVEGTRARATAGELAFGTIDTWLLYRLTEGAVHRTDATNACRTLLFNIHEQRWDPELLAMLNIPEAMLPEVCDNAADFGTTALLGEGTSVPITAMAGDQHAAVVGQGCFQPGMLKSTYGTGCFAVLNTGAQAVPSNNRLLTTLAYRLNGEPTYALEGSIFIAGAAVQWLRDGLGILENAAQSGALADSADSEQDVVLVPAFTGLGAPHWDSEARGAIFGLTRNSGPAEFARAALEAVCFQTNDLLTAMKADWADAARTILRVDGGMTASDWTMQALADILDAAVERPVVTETTALGVAYLAGAQVGFYGDQADFAQRWQLDRRFEPGWDSERRDRKIALWNDAVRRTLSEA